MEWIQCCIIIISICTLSTDLNFSTANELGQDWDMGPF